MDQKSWANHEEENQDSKGPEDHSQKRLAEYNKKFLDLVKSFESLRNSPDIKSLNLPDDSTNENFLSKIADKMVDGLKSDLKPEELLEVIRLVDKIYLQCTMKGRINETLFQFLQEKGSLFSSKKNIPLDKATKEELQDWFTKHQKNLFEK